MIRLPGNLNQPLVTNFCYAKFNTRDKSHEDAASSLRCLLSVLALALKGQFNLCEILLQLAVSFVPWEMTLWSHRFLNVLKTCATYLTPFMFICTVHHGAVTERALLSVGLSLYQCYLAAGFRLHVDIN